MVAEKNTFVSVEEYLEREWQAEYRSEYWNGVIVAMSGGTHIHNQILRNVSFRLANQLHRSECSPYFGETRLHVTECNCYFYPDAQVVCGKPLFAGTKAETLLNPAVVIEVLSDSTEAVDRGRKFACYRTLESLQAYIIIEQDSLSVELHTRKVDGTWLSTYLRGEDAVLSLPEFEFSLPLRDIYERVEFDEDSS